VNTFLLALTAVLIVVLSALFAAPLLAQVATLTGRITDPSGAVIPQAKISVLALSTGIGTATESTAEGYYTIPALTPGRYHLTISKGAFKTPAQSAELQMADGGTVRLKSHHGEAVLPVEITPIMTKGELFSTFHSAGIFLNNITSPTRDRIVHAPEYKVTAVRIEKISAVPDN